MSSDEEKPSASADRPERPAAPLRQRADTTRPPSHPSRATTETLTRTSIFSPLPSPFRGFERAAATPPLPGDGDELRPYSTSTVPLVPESRTLPPYDLPINPEHAGIFSRPQGAEEERVRRHGAQRGAFEPIPSGERGPPPQYAASTPSAQPYQQPPPAAAQPQAAPNADQGLAHTLTRAIENLADTLRSQPSRTPRLPPTYTGSDYEDPRAFLAEAEEYCRRERVEYREWTPVVADRLRGAAHSWYDHYRALNLEYHSFRQRFLERFDGDAILGDLHNKLYSKRQNPSEDVALFITRKLALFRRVDPDLPEATLVKRLALLLAPDIRLQVRIAKIYTIEELIRVAVGIEEDLREVYPLRNSGYRPAASTSNAATSTPRTAANAPPYPCRFCRGNHFHRDCPQRPPPAVAGPSAPPAPAPRGPNRPFNQQRNQYQPSAPPQQQQQPQPIPGQRALPAPPENSSGAAPPQPAQPAMRSDM